MRAPSTLVIVDDHAAIRDGIRQQLRALNNLDVVGEADNGRDAIDLIITTEPTIAVVDVFMPVLDGIGVCEHLRDAGSATNVVLYSGINDPLLVGRGFAGGASAFVCKDSPASTLQDAVRAAQACKQYVDPRLGPALMAEDAPAMTHREFEILGLLASGKRNREIALALGLSSETVKTHIARINGKLGAATRTHAVANAFRRSLLA